MGDKNELSSQENDSEDEADMFCPALPPHLLNKSSSDSTTRSAVVGPTLPPNYKPPDESTYNEYQSESDEDEKELVGPLPPDAGQDERFNVPEMEYRMEKMIKDVEKKDNTKPERESWMLELPSDKPNILGLGLGGRQFRKKNAPDLGDRSVWTDTPEDKERKEKVGKKRKEETAEPSIHDIASKRRDEEISELVNEYQEKKRNVSLVDLHRKKKPKVDESKPKERKPFSREDDLHVNKFDEAQKETILKKARNLNERFSAGNRKFL